MPEAAMATIQAALKRGIEQTFQIESSELVVEALPSAKDRRALLFYEAAEGGAGVLNRLATDSSQLAQVSRLALSLMHYKVSEDTVDPDQLEDTAGANAGPQAHQCEAGCYQCLLSYYNQPDHEIINRRDVAAVRFLAQLAGAAVQGLSPVDVAANMADGEEATLLQEWLNVVVRSGFRQPDQVNISLNGGEATADAVYQVARALVFLTPPAENTSAYAHDRGFTLIVFPSDKSDWLASFAAHPSIFGTPSSHA